MNMEIIMEKEVLKLELLKLANSFVSHHAAMPGLNVRVVAEEWYQWIKQADQAVNKDVVGKSDKAPGLPGLGKAVPKTVPDAWMDGYRAGCKDCSHNFPNVLHS